jgi:hypothetical protein
MVFTRFVQCIHDSVPLAYSNGENESISRQSSCDDVAGRHLKNGNLDTLVRTEKAATIRGVVMFP